MENSTILNQVITLFLIMALGFFLKKRGTITDTVNKKLSEILVDVTNPLLIISSFQFAFSSEKLMNAGVVALFALGLHFILILSGVFIYRKYPLKTRQVLQFITIYANCGYMGFPLLQSIFGKEGIFYASIYVLVFNLYMWTNGVAIFTGKGNMKDLWKHLINPNILAVLVGMVFFLFSFKLPLPLFKAVDMVGSMTAPISMLIIGALLAGMDFRKALTGSAIYFGSIMRLVASPLIAIAAVRLLGLSGLAIGVCVVLSGMPAAANTAIMAEMYDGDSVFASRRVAISTLLSIITIPVVITLLHT